MPLGITMSRAESWIGFPDRTRPLSAATRLYCSRHGTLDVIEKEGLLKNSAEVGAHMVKRMADWPKKHKIVATFVVEAS